jgi:hypothetical protein
VNAKRLYELMKDVPPTAWPEGLMYGENKEEHGNEICDFPIWFICVHGVSDAMLGDYEKLIGRPHGNERQGEIHSLCPPQNAAYMCAGSMAAWLLERGIFLCRSDASGTYYVVDTDNVNHRFGNYRTPVEALAAACRGFNP